jgi:hypothetical protein
MLEGGGQVSALCPEQGKYFLRCEKFNQNVTSQQNHGYYIDDINALGLQFCIQFPFPILPFSPNFTVAFRFIFGIFRVEVSVPILGCNKLRSHTLSHKVYSCVGIEGILHNYVPHHLLIYALLFL